MHADGGGVFLRFVLIRVATIFVHVYNRCYPMIRSVAVISNIRKDDSIPWRIDRVLFVFDQRIWTLRHMFLGT